jgi:uncharacterized protein YdhG (YjbR/CyaY superfamily)
MKKQNPIDSYLSSLPSNRRKILSRVRQTIKKAVPESEEGVSYRMPVFKYFGVVMYFAAFKEHYSVFVRPKYLSAFKKKVAGFKTTKAGINIPFDGEIPVRLILKLAQYAADNNRKDFKGKPATW